MNNTFILLRWVGALLLLPINVLIIIPAIFLDLNAPEFNNWTSWLSVVIGFLGLTLVVSCVRLFAKSGDGTPAPWDPVDNLIAHRTVQLCKKPDVIWSYYHLIFRGPSILVTTFFYLYHVVCFT